MHSNNQSTSCNTLATSSVQLEAQQAKVRRLEEQLENQKKEMTELKAICGPVLTRLSLNCEQILELIQSEMLEKRR